MHGRDYAVLPSPDEHEEYEEEVSREQEDEDKEQAEFIGQYRRELEARVIELRNNQQ